ncbi:hypothetical protein QBC39DRAFT_290595 [Podospora conica]|nr:hypothetical protein QBC39DRAFT_290595 [Schizothecium conicum]
MNKTLLLCFIHGFKGGESTFGDNYAFTEDLRRRVARALPKINVKAEVYPKYETRGDLNECVGRFRDWLLNKVIDLEVLANTHSPTVDPHVHVVLIGHSMGGIVAAETAIAVTSEHPIHGSTNPTVDDDSNAPPPRPPTPNSLMFPYIRGVLAFDTPFLGVSPGVVAHGAEGHLATAQTALAQISGLTGLFGGAKAAASADARAATAAARKPIAALPAPENNNRDNKNAPAPAADAGWGRWGKIAMVAGAVGAVAAGGAAAYINRDQLSQGWTSLASHMEFVGCLARKEELRRRTAYMVKLNRELGMGFGNLYTRLGKAASSRTDSVVGTVLGNERTFCVVPKKDVAGDWRPAVNDKATDETVAHMSMFEPKENPGYEKLANDATEMIASWFRTDWYETSSAGAVRA